MSLSKRPPVPPLELIPEPNMNPEEWEKIVRHYMELSKKSLRKDCNKAGKIEVETRFDMESSLVKRRIQALLNTRDEIMKRSACGYSEWIMLNTQSESYGALESYDRLLFAASIWILDRITESGVDEKELYELLPTDDRVIDDMFQIDVWDCCYDDDLIVSVEYVLHYRNRDIAPMEDNGCNGHRVFTSRLAAEGKDHADVPSRQAFEKLLALIPQEKIDQAVQQFTDCFRAWIDRFFAGIKDLEDELETMRLKINEKRVQINEQQKKIELLFRNAEAKKANQKKAAVKRQVINPLLAKPQKQDDVYSMASAVKNLTGEPSANHELIQVMGEIDYLHKLDAQNKELVEEYLDQVQKKHAYVCFISSAGVHSMEGYEDVFDAQFLRSLPPLPDFDCYGMCFALLYLIEQNSDLPWLYGACISMMRDVISCLPWGCNVYDESNDEFWENECPPEPLKPVEIPDWYERKYFLRSKDADPDTNRSLAQIVYEVTGCIMPRDMHRYDGIVKQLNRFGLRGNNINAVLYSMLALSYSKHRMRAMNFEDWTLSSDEQEAENPEKKKLLPEELEKKIAAQQQEIRQLQAALHSAEKSARDANRKLEQQKAEAEAERRELADLRERLFYHEIAESSDESVDQSQFPYAVQKTTIIFGGHETFLKTIRKLLSGNIRFVDREQSFDVTMIRYADVLWIQPNAISHKQYYKIAGEARKHKKPMRYFQYASALKCAEQIIENDV